MLTVLKNILKKAQLICSLFVCLFCIQAMGMQQIKDALDNTDDADARDLAEYIELNPDIDIKDFLKIILLGDGVNPHGNLGWSVAATKIRH
ncbi:MAG: hypothetical protein LBJ89_04055, partial [Holosporales bacterium]|nr:hypothetical protein [Holosporales bacterium]